jgi:hypothetical protein
MASKTWDMLRLLRRGGPVGYVATGEFSSPDCDAINPFDLNAWEMEPVRQGITVCKLPDSERPDS